MTLSSVENRDFQGQIENCARRFLDLPDSVLPPVGTSLDIPDILAHFMFEVDALERDCVATRRRFFLPGICFEASVQLHRVMYHQSVSASKPAVELADSTIAWNVARYFTAEYDPTRLHFVNKDWRHFWFEELSPLNRYLVQEEGGEVVCSDDWMYAILQFSYYLLRVGRDAARLHVLQRSSVNELNADLRPIQTTWLASIDDRLKRSLRP